MPSSSLFPPLARRPRGFGLALVALLGSAGALLGVGPGAFPGDPALPYAPVTLNLHWQVHTRGVLGYLADDLHNLPYRTDRSVVDGLPLDALASAPFTAALGFQAGMWAYALLLLWAVGAAGAWLGARWWGGVGAALVTGVGWQVAEVVLRELSEGRSTQVFAAVFLPLCLGLGVRAADDARARSAVAAGLVAALATLASWDFALLAIPLVLGPSLVRREWAAAATVVAAYGALVLPAAGWVWSGIAELPSASSDPWQAAPLQGGLTRPVDLAVARIHGVDGVALRTVRPLLLALAALAVLRAHRGRGTAGGVLGAAWWPGVVAGIGVVLGLGHWLPGPVVAPWGFTSLAKGAMRLWWADRAWLLPALSLALLAGGVAAGASTGAASPGAASPGPASPGPASPGPASPGPASPGATRRLDDVLRRWPQPVALLAAALLVGEAAALSPALPMPTVSLAPSDTARALATSPDPVLLLPLGGGPLRGDRLDLVDQVTHGRPMSGGTRYPFDITAPRGLDRGWRENPTLRALGACEGHPAASAGPVDPAVDPAVDGLAHVGIREVWLDTRYLAGSTGAAYRACVEAALEGWVVDTPPGFVRLRAPGATAG